MRAFLDTNVLLDYLLKREPFYDSALSVGAGRIIIYTSHTLLK